MLPLIHSVRLWITTHPWSAAGIAWGMVLCLLLFLFWMRGQRIGFRSGGLVPGPGLREGEVPVILGLPRELQLRCEDRITPELERVQDALRRIPMQSRFVPDTAESPSRSAALVDQILGDQATAHAEPGKRTNRPAPGERYYHPPRERVRVSVGPYTVVLDRAFPTGVSEARPDGAEWPMAEVPEAWEPVVIALAMEVLRLREGWSVEDPA